ncbi:hypothetical protein M3Y98_00320300 [Aphelenchoides besseyi]|nr:hypothetical protein M3Y98_00320200 [Aphelenchoides besseyi]KAI6188125.1 hypothetical protein M3Y98_00320300 [Aphelenchoides besseyi]KAI6201402.1 hypothetical protein M3Y96_00838000 [Aphelenchoides besseyi]
MSDERNNCSLDESQYLALPYNEFDVLVTDIDENELTSIGQMYEIENLSAGNFSCPAFPVDGHILKRNLRYMVPLVCQWAEKPNKPSVNIWFLIDTGAPFTCLTMKSLKAILGANKEIPENAHFEIAIQDQNSNIQCRVSKAHYKEVNILGADALSELKLWLRGNWEKNKFQLYKQ